MLIKILFIFLLMNTSIVYSKSKINIYDLLPWGEKSIESIKIPKDCKDIISFNFLQLVCRDNYNDYFIIHRESDYGRVFRTNLIREM